MSDLATALERLRATAADLATAKLDYETRIRARDEALRAAQAAGATYTAMQDAAGVSNVTVTKALRRE